jgi:two-component system sensor histidine kinase RegB
MLYLTGGIINPFSLLLIAPVTLAAATLPARFAAAIGALAVAACLVLAFFNLPLPYRPSAGPGPVPGGLTLMTIVLSRILGIAVTGAYAWQAATESARMELALNVTETVLAREQRLSALGALAAAAAHELGTPLATISVVAREMVRNAPDEQTREDAELMIGQAARCREILARLTEMPEAKDAVHERISLVQLVHEVIEPHMIHGVRVEAVVNGPPGDSAPDIWRRAEILHALTTIVENAVDFARAEVIVVARFDARAVVIEVRDDGPGFSPEILAKLGEPYVTSRPGAEGSGPATSAWAWVSSSPRPCWNEPGPPWISRMDGAAARWSRRAGRGRRWRRRHHRSKRAVMKHLRHSEIGQQDGSLVARLSVGVGRR